MIHRILTGTVRHYRKGTIENRFAYRQYYLCLSLKNLEHLNTSLLSHNRFNLFSFHDRDYGNRQNTNLESWIQKNLQQHLPSALSIDNIYLITQPRILGWVFNPVSFFICCDPQDAIRCVFAEVNNTFGDHLTYFIHRPDFAPLTLNDQIFGSKQLHVSPFYQVKGTYGFRFQITNDSFGAWIDYHVQDTSIFNASLTGSLKPLTSLKLLGLFFRIPLANLKTFTLIHYQALKLWLKGIRCYSKPSKNKVEIVECKKEKPKETNDS